MNGRKITGVVVDSGHGGSDPGAISGNLREKDFTLEAANYMTKRLQELGFPVVAIKTTDEDISRTERLRRANEAFNGDPNAILISNHINSGGGDNPSGKLTFFEKKFNKFSKYDIIFTEKAVFNL
ncbi:MAG: N-acetylmuramoyl-L-alanine amidase [Bacilli bacterium]|nr:N-acetylmuramoyl-L-alanine amidase [Bacilli bacterium]